MGFRPEHYELFRTTEIRSKLFIHTYGLVEQFGEGEKGIMRARQYGIDSIRAVEQSPHITMDHCGVVGIVWGDISTNQRVCDVVPYLNVDWKENMEIRPVFVRDGTVTKEGTLCEDGFILLGRLSHLRRNTASPLDFFGLDTKPEIIVPEYVER